MKYQCVDPTCKAIFHYPAKKTELKITMNLTFKENDDMKVQTQNTEGLETHVCPVCKGMFFMEYDEPQPDIISMKSVDINQVDEYLKQGYKVKESSTTKACIIKVAPKDAEPCKEATEAYSKLDGALP
jgi:hypothetical protein